MERNYVIGVDFGSDSVRAIIVDCSCGQSVAEAVQAYPRWTTGLYQHPERQVFRQHPLDYVDAFTSCMQALLYEAGDDARRRIRALSFATTGSTPCPVDRHGTPLALLDAFAQNENAMFHLWKDHSAINEAEEINAIFSNWHGVNYTKYQGAYSSEWYWAKILRTARQDPAVAAAAFSWVEHSDWMPALLTGRCNPLTMYRNACAAGHKALWHSEWGGLPSAACLSSLHPHLAAVRESFASSPQSSIQPVGIICAEWAQKLGLPEGVVIGGSSFDAHAGGIGAGIRAGTMVCAMGTSCVGLLVESAQALREKKLTHLCGMAENSILPGLMGIETGQAAFGDVFSWFSKALLWPIENMLRGSDILSSIQYQALFTMLKQNILPELEKAAAASEPYNALVAVDWFNGRRYPTPNEAATGALVGLDIGTDAPHMYRALMESVLFGLRRIYKGLIAEGIHIDNVIAVGGVARKSPFLMQMAADILGCPLGVSACKQTVARGAAIYAAVSAKIFPDIAAAQACLCEPVQTEFIPNKVKHEEYAHKAARYEELGERLEF